MVSAINRSDGSGGQIQVPRDAYSLRMSFWIVPVSFSRGTPFFSAAATYRASRIAAVPLMVKLVLILSSGMPSKSTSASASVSTATPTRPTSSPNSASSESYPHCVGRSRATDNPVPPWPSRYR
jgi:hypothetical protein